MQRSRCDWWENHSWLLHHDNAPAHTALNVRQFLASKQVICLEHPPYLPDLAPCDVWLFPKMKATLKGTHFASVEEIKTAVTRQLRDLKEEDFTECFQGWQRRMNKCIYTEGDYFEGDEKLFVFKLATKCLVLKISFLFCHTS